MNGDIETDRDVKLLVGHFYTRIREDTILGNIFNNIASVDWVEHLPTMCSFWETVLFHRPGYKGNPLLPHVELDRCMRNEHDMGLQPADFDRWISLFHTTIDGMFAGPCAERAKRGASRMAEHMLLAIANSENPLGVITGTQGAVAPRGYQIN